MDVACQIDIMNTESEEDFINMYSSFGEDISYASFQALDIH